ncbi:hypothetical protein [Neobacillus soli]|uniref:hypothetical protein n=1 Tax=Neobacillus soli TaxID=220688 RepID=UPI001155E531|nr:hypothetical protein [Neobacillus soli]
MSSYLQKHRVEDRNLSVISSRRFYLGLWNQRLNGSIIAIMPISGQTHFKKGKPLPVKQVTASRLLTGM